MTILQELKAAKSEGYAEAKTIYPFVAVDMQYSVYDRADKKLNDGAVLEMRKLTKRNLDQDVELLRDEFPEADRIYVDFIYRGADNMQDFSDYNLEIIDGAEMSVLVSSVVIRLTNFVY